jgi:4-diphosphocytidyl-2-C-methyl-D-erythritol kinase
MRALRVLAPAKVNIYLRVLGRRPDGYHDLETLFQTVDLHDELILRENTGESKLEVPGHPRLERDNLVLKAVRLVEALIGRSLSLNMRLIKRIPVAGGLGGGSSDAAAALVGIDALFSLGLADSVLRDAARQLGADVPFFLTGGSAVGFGVGDRLTPAPLRWTKDLLLVNPNFPVSTALVFKEFSKRLTETKRQATLDFRGNEQIAPEDVLCTDLQAVAERLFPEILEIHEWLQREGLSKALMSGSGPTVFGIGERKALMSLKDRIPAKWSAFVVRPRQGGVTID